MLSLLIGFSLDSSLDLREKRGVLLLGGDKVFGQR
jgi:hypothetical protein